MESDGIQTCAGGQLCLGPARATQAKGKKNKKAEAIMRRVKQPMHRSEPFKTISTALDAGRAFFGFIILVFDHRAAVIRR